MPRRVAIVQEKGYGQIGRVNPIKGRGSIVDGILIIRFHKDPPEVKVHDFKAGKLVRLATATLLEKAESEPPGDGAAKITASLVFERSLARLPDEVVSFG